MANKKPKMVLTEDNYFSVEAEMEYMGSTQFKNFMKCERDALNKITNPEPPTTAMLVGSYVDAYFTGEIDKFKVEHPEIFKKDGTLLSNFVQANDIIQAIEDDPMFKSYISGDNQKIMVGEIAGVPFKIKVDSLLEHTIVDLKCMSSIYDLEWKQDSKGNYYKADFVDTFGYDIQGAIYQEIVRQNTGEKMPFVLAVATKEKNPDRMLIQIDQEYLDRALELVRELAPHFDLVKQGIVPPLSCGKCATCRATHKVTQVVSYKDLFHKDNGEQDTNY